MVWGYAPGKPSKALKTIERIQEPLWVRTFFNGLPSEVPEGRTVANRSAALAAGVATSGLTKEKLNETWIRNGHIGIIKF